MYLTQRNAIDTARRIVRLCRDPYPGKQDDEERKDRAAVSELAKQTWHNSQTSRDAALDEARAWVVKNIIDGVV